jgi:hypothetical protein
MRRAARIDTTAKQLIAVVKACGAKYLPLNGVIDGVVLSRGKVWLVDWKSPGGTLTPAQAKLIAAGWPIHCWSDEQQVILALRGPA